ALHHQPGQDVDQRRLARAIGAEQPENLPARNVEAYLVQRALGRAALRHIGLAQLGNADRRLGRAGHADSHSAAPRHAKANAANQQFTLIDMAKAPLTLSGGPGDSPTVADVPTDPASRRTVKI